MKDSEQNNGKNTGVDKRSAIGKKTIYFVLSSYIN